MGLFTAKNVAWRRKVQNHADSRSEFDQLQRLIGRDNTKRYVEMIYDKWVSFNYKIEDLKFKDAAAYIKMERENYSSRKQYVDSLVPQTLGGQLGTLLNAHTRDVGDYYKNPLRGGMAGRDLAIDQAANWVCGSYVAALPSTRALLEHYVPATSGHHGPMGFALGRTTQHLRDVHRRAVPDAPAYRINLMGGAKYPSTVGGSHLLDHIVGLTAGTNVWPAFGDAHWESIAMFYLVSIVHVQGFSDGNKRTGHLAYAIVLLKGMHRFKAPTGVKENELFRMNA